MRVDDALGQIAQIHDHLARGEQYRGLSPARRGGVRDGRVCWQRRFKAWVVPAGDPAVFAVYWLIVAAIGGRVGIGPAVEAYIRRENEFAQRRTRRVVGQFLPCVVAGLCITLALQSDRRRLVRLCCLASGSCCSALGVFAARPYLPRSIGWVGLFYLAAGYSSSGASA